MINRTRALALSVLVVVAACDSTGPGEPDVVITGITPAVLAPGVTATISGSGFAATAAGNEVTIAGVTVPVTSASADALVIDLPASAFPCAAGGSAEVMVRVGEKSASRSHPIEGPTAHAIGVGDKLVLQEGARCVELTEPGRYLLSVFNTSTQPSATTAFRLRGSGAGGVATDVAAGAAWSGDRFDGQSVSAPSRTWHDHDAVGAHLRILRKNLDLLERLGPAAAARSSYDTRSVTTMSVPVVGDTQSFRIPDLDATSPCTSFKEVTGRVVYVGARGVIFEDQTAPLAGQMDARWTVVGEEFDAIMYQIAADYFGDPLIMDPQLDDNGRLFMLFSEEVNDFEGSVAGFVFSGDLFTRNQCQSSDTAEIFYGIVPTSSASGFPSTGDRNTVDRWQWTMRSTVIHEVKHIVSFATRLVLGRPFEELWLEEATARLAEELYARALFDYGQNDDTEYGESIYCEVRPTFPECEGTPYVMAKHFGGGVTEYYESMETLTPIGRANEDDFSFYGSGWLLVRWAIDNSGVNEVDFVRALTSSNLTGVSNLAARAGRSFAEMLPDFTLSTALDNRSGFAARPWLAFPSWHTRSIFAGFHSDFGSAGGYPTPFPLSTRNVTYGEFDIAVPILRSGTGSLFELSGTMQGSQTVHLVGEGGGAAPASLGLALVRIQ